MGQLVGLFVVYGGYALQLVERECRGRVVMRICQCVHTL